MHTSELGHEKMIRKGGHRSSPATNAERVCSEIHTQIINESAMVIRQKAVAL
jgi:hypothetical protein